LGWHFWRFVTWKTGLNGPRGLKPAALWLLLGVAAISGCTGHGTVYGVPFMRRDFPPTEPPAQVVQAGEAYYWIDGQKRLNVALRRHVPSLLGKAFEYDWLMSLVLEDLPAGSEKLYYLGMDSVRQLASYGGAHQRSTSLTGIAVIHAPSRWELRGRFHATVRQQQFTVLTGWAPDLGRAPMIVQAGTFEAVHDPESGKAIRDRTEADGFARGIHGGVTTRPLYIFYPVQTQPASQPAKPILGPATAPNAARER